MWNVATLRGIVESRVKASQGPDFSWFSVGYRQVTPRASLRLRPQFGEVLLGRRARKEMP
jgi:hypothetical protein